MQVKQIKDTERCEKYEMQRKERETRTLQLQEAKRKKEEETQRQRMEEQRRKQEVSFKPCYFKFILKFKEIK